MKTGAVLAAIAVLLAGSGERVFADAVSPRHLIYLHGRIVQEEQRARPRHPRFGYYELEKIKDALRGRGFVVSADIRPRSASVSESADRVVAQVRRLLGSGVPAGHVTVVGASMGGAIALVASARLQNPDVRFCILGGCLSESVHRLPIDEGKAPSGHILSIREASDDLTRSCPTWSQDHASESPLFAREIVLHTGLGHGFHYQPLKEWLDPVVEWASAR
jgi:pimeloyl-ACP methyl ester carboxylesterase